ncbi:HpcH/HpaI aldolase family protein [Shinella pollutisoli]|uniref:HpcH/HpaI aldolase/citrate lyase family protein n=1 Tax=Shinella pollutisoli TaxID=2250594 RepID=A0ABV7DLF3_9HYPH|nr:aldolase/citrate lyase family protein [Shinella pollutisoli]
MNLRTAFSAPLRNKSTVLGTWMQIPDTYVAEIMAQAGFDFVLVDGEHAPVTPEDLRVLLPAFEKNGTPVLYRVRKNASDAIKAALDQGIPALMVPMVNSAEEAREVVAAAKYPPAGVRGMGPLRASNFYMNEAAYVAAANAETAVVVQIETRGGLEAVEEIAAVPGIDCLYVGPADLAMSLGIKVGVLSEELKAACARVCAAAAGNGIAAGIDVASLDFIPAYRELGFTLFTHGLDTGYLADGGRQTSAKLRELCS